MLEIVQRLSELERRFNNVLRFGVVEAVDPTRARVRVRFGPDHVSATLPWLAARADGTNAAWDAPGIDERVLVLAPTGTLETAVVLPALYHDGARPPTSDPAVVGRRFNDSGEVLYDSGTSHLRAVLPEKGKIEIRIGASQLVMDSKDATIKLPGKLAVEAAQIELNGDVSLGGADGKPVARVGDAVAGGKIKEGSDKVVAS